MLHTLRKRRLPLVVGAGLLFVIVLVLLLLPREADLAFAGSAQSAEARRGTLATTVTGTGNLITESGQAIRIPAGLVVEEVFVSPGDLVQRGDLLATFDMGSIQSQIAAVQAELRELDEELERVRTDTEPTTITAGVSGRIKAIFAEEGDLVTATVVQHQALALLSIDGRMAVDISADLSIGEEVTVALASGAEHRGTVERSRLGLSTVTLTDNGPALGEAATIYNGDGIALGSGLLYIHQPLAVLATSGRVQRVHLAENAEVRAATTLFTLTDVDASPAYRELFSRRQDEAQMLHSLLALAQTGALHVGFDGIVESVSIGNGGAAPSSGPSLPGLPPGIPPGLLGMRNDADGGEATMVRLAGQRGGGEVGLVRLSNSAPESDPEFQPEPSPEPELPPEPPAPPPLPEFQEITTLSDLILAPPQTGAIPQVEVEGAAYIGLVQWSPLTPIFLPDTVYHAAVLLEAAPGHVFGSAVLRELETEGFPTPDASVLEVELLGPILIVTLRFPPTAELQLPNLPGLPGFPSLPSFNLPSFSLPSMPGMNPGAFVGAGGSGQNPNEITAFTIAAADAMQLVVSIDERDILALEVGQGAKISLDAIEGESFPGEISRINAAGTTAGGGARYAVEISIPRTPEMLPGMSASAVITTQEVSDILLIPLEAIQEEGFRIYVYTALVGGVPGEPVEVWTGLSDGLYVEILSGLTEGDMVYYILRDTFRWPHFGIGPGFGGGGGGGR